MAAHAAVTEQHLEAMRTHYGREIENARAAGLLREERYIHSPQAAEIDVDTRPAPSPVASSTCARTTTSASRAIPK